MVNNSRPLSVKDLRGRIYAVSVFLGLWVYSPNRMKQPGYDERTKKIADECANDSIMDAVRAEIYKDLVESVKIIKQHRHSDDAPTSLRACKEHLTLAGLYVARHEHSGEVTFVPVKISSEDFGDE